jgi:stage II sporulation protein M
VFGNMTFKSYMREHVSLYIFVIVLFVMGVVFGAIMVNTLSLDQKQEILQLVGSFFYTLTDRADSGGQDLFLDSLLLHAKWILLIWLFGISIIGLPLILVLDFLKGVLIGFSIGYLVGQFSWKGLLFALASVAPQNVIVIPALIVSSVTAIAFSIRLIKNRFLRSQDSRKPMLQPLVRYSGTTGVFIFLLVIAAVLEGFVTPALMREVAPLLVAP